jgi:hypothetical protein
VFVQPWLLLVALQFLNRVLMEAEKHQVLLVALLVFQLFLLL